MDKIVAGVKTISNRIMTSVHCDQEYVEAVVCNESDINENEMKNFDIGEHGKVLLVKQRGVISALGAKCTHYGALLSTGALGDGRIRCPWHGACFNIKTGDIEDFPGSDSLPCFEVTILDGQVKVRAPVAQLRTSKRTKSGVAKSDDERAFIVIGGGPSGASCVESLRSEGFTGRIVFVCKENSLPYDRIKLSKAMDLDVKTLHLRDKEFYEKHNVDVYVNTEAVSLDTAKKEVSLSNGYKINYDKIYIATGSTPRKLNIPGAELPQVLTLRNFDDAKRINSLLTKETHVAVLGSSFIGLEVAAYCVGKVAKVTIIGKDSVPLKFVFGEVVGQRILEFFREKNVNCIMQSGIVRCNSVNEQLESVQLNDGTNLKADVLVMGVGSTFNTDFLKTSGINLNENGTIDTDCHLQTNVPDVFVGGDIANAPLFISNNQRVAIGHFGMSQYHGSIAAKNMLMKDVPLKSVPFFWAFVFGKSIRYAGRVDSPPSNIQIFGDLQDMKFVAYYFDEQDKATAIATCGYDPVCSQFAELLYQGKSVYKHELMTCTDHGHLAWTQKITA